MTADQRVTAARELLDAVMPYPVAGRPVSVLRREDAELRRMLRQLLDLLADYEDAAEDETASHATLWGGAHIVAADMQAALGQALADAVSYRDPSGACPDCEASPSGLCLDHEAGAGKAGSYRALARDLGVEL
jgi:hypothetical protein